jgi:hypothetical protein
MSPGQQRSLSSSEQAKAAAVFCLVSVENNPEETPWAVAAFPSHTERQMMHAEYQCWL